jgi:hypothetical protein
MLAIRDSLNEIIELTPAVPKLHKLGVLLRGLEYGEEQEDDQTSNEDSTGLVRSSCTSCESEMLMEVTVASADIYI